MVADDQSKKPAEQAQSSKQVEELKPKVKWQNEYNPPAKALDHTGQHQVEAISIGGRMVHRRERLQGMTDSERAWRAQFLKDQILAPDEPRYVESFYKERYNPLRRFYRWPMEKFESALRGPLGETGAGFVRHAIAKTVLMLMGGYYMWYHCKYNHATWSKKSSWKMYTNKPVMFPEDPGYPNYHVPADDDYGSYGFKESVFYK